MTERSLDFILIEMDSHCRYLSMNSISKGPLFYFVENKLGALFAVRMEIRTPAFAIIYARDNGDFNTSRACGREGNGSPLKYSCLENPMGGGAW